MKKKYTLERLAKDRSIVSIFVHFDPKHYEKPRSFSWEDRNKIRWYHVVRCRLDWKEPQWHNVDGDARICYGFRINPE